MKRIKEGFNMHNIPNRVYCAYSTTSFAVAVYSEYYEAELNGETVKRFVYHVVAINLATNCAIKYVRTLKTLDNAIKWANKVRNEEEKYADKIQP